MTDYPLTTRIAPSPTGFMHVGTARTALHNWLAARSTGGKFILRIDDTDADRNIEEAVTPILDGLTWLGLGWDEMYRQSERTDLYRRRAAELLAAGHAFEADNGAVILHWRDFMPRTWRDDVAGDIPITPTTIEQIDGRLVLLRGGDKLGAPTYQFASIVDDYEMGVNLIIRGTDHLTNTAKQVAIWTALTRADGTARELPRFAHVGLIFRGGKKMSKRDGAASLIDYRDGGTHPEAMFNFLLRMGWGPKEDNKANSVLTRERAFELFLKAGNLRGSNASFDDAKLASYDRRFKAMDEKAGRATEGPKP